MEKFIYFISPHISPYIPRWHVIFVGNHLEDCQSIAFVNSGLICETEAQIETGVYSNLPKDLKILLVINK